MTDDAVISARGLRKAFGRHRVLDQLDLTIRRGAAVGLLGGNGAGKTTLLKALLGFISVDAGRSTLFGEDTSALSSSVRARLAYVPQTTAQFHWLTGQAMLGYVSHFYPAFDREYARDLCDRWKLALRSPIGILSPGQQQRLSIVRALATRPELIFLDEPISALDPATRLAVIEELAREREKRHATLIFSSHLIADLERLCSHFAVLAGGRIAVMEDLQWFRALARARLQGDDRALDGLPIPSAALIRKSAHGERTALLDRSVAARLCGSLPADIRIEIDDPDLEAAASEWMQ